VGGERFEKTGVRVFMGKGGYVHTRINLATVELPKGNEFKKKEKPIAKINKFRANGGASIYTDQVGVFSGVSSAKKKSVWKGKKSPTGVPTLPRTREGRKQRDYSPSTGRTRAGAKVVEKTPRKFRRPCGRGAQKKTKTVGEGERRQKGGDLVGADGGEPGGQRKKKKRKKNKDPGQRLQTEQ